MRDLCKEELLALRGCQTMGRKSGSEDINNKYHLKRRLWRCKIRLWCKNDRPLASDCKVDGTRPQVFNGRLLYQRCL